MITTTQSILSPVGNAVADGLLRTPKKLPSWLFYDDAGDKLFQAIMEMPEYYLTASEYEILEKYKERFREIFSTDSTMFDLVELGAGDGMKTEVLLQHFAQASTALKYQPVDVSRNALSGLTARLERSVPAYPVFPIALHYEDALDHLALYKGNRRVYLFLGANIGNFTLAEAVQFTSRISSGMRHDDQLMIGFDVKKDPRLILTAYNDPHGITRDFNLNLLSRINRELGADFNISQFEHYPVYDPENGEAKSFLVSRIAQEVSIEALRKTVYFGAGETIHTEVSQKYDLDMISQLAQQADLTITGEFYDSKRYFVDVLFRKKI